MIFSEKSAIFRDHALGRLGGEALRLLDRLLDGADHIEGRLRQMVVLAVAQALEAADRIGEIDEYARRTGEHLGDMEGLRQEALDLAGARDGDLVLLRQFVHAEDRDDVLERLVALEHLLDLAGNLIML